MSQVREKERERERERKTELECVCKREKGVLCCVPFTFQIKRLKNSCFGEKKKEKQKRSYEAIFEKNCQQTNCREKKFPKRKRILTCFDR